jgi:tetratricopeptide (TPR) repeat protein
MFVFAMGVAQAAPDAPVPAAPSSAAAPASAPASAPAAPASATAPARDPDVAFSAGRFTEAEAGYAERIKQRPDAPKPRYQHAVAAALAGHAQQSEASAAAVARLDPGNESALLLAAGARALRRRTVAGETSLAAVHQALADGRLRTAARLAAHRLSHEAPEAERGPLHLARGRALLALGQSAEAAVALKSAAGLGAGSASVWLAVGRSFVAAGRLEAAQASFQAALGSAASQAMAAQAQAQLIALRRLRSKRKRTR